MRNRDSKKLLLWLLILLASLPSVAFASLCGDTITTAWSSATTLYEETRNDTSFTACSTASLFQGSILTSDPDPFTYSVEAIDDDTIDFSVSITDLVTGIPDGPAFTVELSDIDWLGGSGFISDVIDNEVSDSITVDSFTGDSIIFSGGGFADECSSGSGCTIDYLAGSFDIVARAVPEPSTLALMALGLMGIGFGRCRFVD